MSMTYDSSLIGKKLSVVDEIILLNPNQTPLINLLGFSQPVTQTTHQWFEDEMFSNSSTVVGAKLVSDTSVVVTSAEPFRTGQVIKIGQELLLVTAVAGTTLTVTRGYAGTTAAAIADAAKIEVMFVEGNEGANARAARFKARAPLSNYTQIFDDSIEVSGTAEAVQQYGVTDLYEYEKQKKQIELALSLEKALINGIGYQNGNTRQMKGIRSFIQTNVQDAAAAALNDDHINNAAQAIYEKGGFQQGGNYVIMVGPKQKRAISAFQKTLIRIQQAENSRGQRVDHYVTDFGNFEIVLNINLAPDEMYIVDTNRMEIRPLIGRDFFHMYQGITGDATKGLLVGEYTLELMQEKAHARVKGLA